MITRKTIIEILEKNITKNKDGVSVIYTEDFYDIASDIMKELVRGIKPKKECLSGLSHNGKHEPIFTDPEGIYCGLCGIDLEYNE